MVSSNGVMLFANSVRNSQFSVGFFFTSERRDVQLVRARRIPRKNCCRKMENISLRLFKSTFESLFSEYENSALSIVTVKYL